MGLNTVGDLLALPVSSLKKRLGIKAVEVLDELTGKSPDFQIKTMPSEFDPVICL